MRSMLIENSIITFACLRLSVMAKAGLADLDGLLGTVNRYSRLYHAFRSALSGSRDSLQILLSNTGLLRPACSSILRGLHLIARDMTGFLATIYYGSIFMDIVGRAAVNSRCLK